MLFYMYNLVPHIEKRTKGVLLGGTQTDTETAGMYGVRRSAGLRLRAYQVS
jgi:hypothetical protein